MLYHSAELSKKIMDTAGQPGCAPGPGGGAEQLGARRLDRVAAGAAPAAWAGCMCAAQDASNA